MIYLGRRRQIIAARALAEKLAKEKPNEEVQETRQEELPEVKGRGPRQLCPNCKKVPNYYFHRIHCKGV